MINATVILSFLSMIGYFLAVILLALRSDQVKMGISLKIPLFLALLLFGFISCSNLLEHSGITDFFDPLEDVAEIVFTLVLLFFVHNWRRQKSFEIIRNQEIWLRSALASMGDGVVTTDQAGSILFMNQAMARLSGESLEAVLGQKADKVFKFYNRQQSGDTAYHPFGTALAGVLTRSVPRRIGITSREGRAIPVTDSVAPILGPGNEVLGFVGVFRDMTEYEALTAQLAHGQKMEAIGQLSGGIAHDLNNMLAGIMGAADVMQGRMENQGNTDNDKLLSIILGAAENARDLTANLLAFSRKSRLFSTPICVREVLEKTKDLANRAIDKRVSLKAAWGPDALMVVGEPSQLQNAFLNLVINGCDAMPEGGTITMAAEKVVLDASFCSRSGFKILPGPYVAVSVTDTGTGILPELQSRVFEPFFTTKAEGKGTGLGLAAVYQTAVKHHGAVTLKSQPGEGACFTVYLPEAEMVIQRQEAASVAPEPHAGTILLIDDEDMLRSSLEIMLEDLGFHLYTADSGKKGIEIFKAHRDRIDLVLLDMVMPGMTGLEVHAALSAMDAGERVLFMSGMDQPGTLPERAAGFVHKPFKRSELIAAVNQAINRLAQKSGQ